MHNINKFTVEHDGIRAEVEYSFSFGMFIALDVTSIYNYTGFIYNYKSCDKDGNLIHDEDQANTFVKEYVTTLCTQFKILQRYEPIYRAAFNSYKEKSKALYEALLKVEGGNEQRAKSGYELEKYRQIYPKYIAEIKANISDATNNKPEFFISPDTLENIFHGTGI